MTFSSAVHFARGARIASARCALLRFKFLGDFIRRVNEEIVRRAYFMNGAELQQGKSDVAACDANLDSETPTASTPGCMAQSGYVFVRRNQAEDVRAAVAAQRVRPTDNEHSWQSVSWPALV
jgi:hypothetical protein